MTTDATPRQLRPVIVWTLAVVSIAMIAGQFVSADIPVFVWGLTPLYAGAMLLAAKRSVAAGIAFVIAVQAAGAVGVGLVSGKWDYAFYGWLQVATVASLIICPVLGRALLKDRTGLDRRVLAGGLAATLFFAVSNFCVWALAPAELSMYPKTLDGLKACYVAGIPFYVRTLVGVVGWTAVLFSQPVLSWAMGRETLRAAETESSAVL